MLNDFLTWIWCLCVISGGNPLRDTPYAAIFENKFAESWPRTLLFVFVWGYMAGVNGLAGHELIHKRS